MLKENDDVMQCDKNNQQIYINYLKSTNSSLKSILTRLRINAQKLGEIIDDVQAEGQNIGNDNDATTDVMRP